MSNLEPDIISQIGTQVREVVSGADALPLQQALIPFYRAIATALGKLDELNPVPPEREQMLVLIVRCYEEVLARVEQMDEALESEDFGALSGAFTLAEAGVREVDRLLQQDREALEKEC
jgi:hypothetical protein